jgi:hypothetical protein
MADQASATVRVKLHAWPIGSSHALVLIRIGRDWSLEWFARGQWYGLIRKLGRHVDVWY